MASKNGTRLTIDKSGRIVVPKRLRDALGLQAESELEISAQSDGMFVRVVHDDSALVRIDGLWVHRGSAGPDADWNRVLDDVRVERVAAVLKP
ncbi:MAG TPA: AbrB/MazE/SpoVT family DNA-binding domain-containing protein [Patescibacteria group bacterium]|nr:AbrB/MazE/SpoVT family DNA-binding domain-containing protein [Patescibacteria group bacterium]